MHHALREQERDNTDGDVDEEDPVPAVVIGDPSAKRGPNRRRHDHGHPIDCESHIALCGRKDVGEDGLLAWSKSATAKPLHDAK
jgi:hypothetical protein